MKKNVKKVIETIAEITYLFFLVLMWVVNHYRWDISRYQLIAMSIVIAISWTCIIFMRDIKKIHKYVFTALTVISVIVVVFWGKLP